MSADRSTRREVRNPLLGLPGVRRLQLLPPDVRAAIVDALKEIRMDARERAEKAWRSHKAPWPSIGRR